MQSVESSSSLLARRVWRRWSHFVWNIVSARQKVTGQMLKNAMPIRRTLTMILIVCKEIAVGHQKRNTNGRSSCWGPLSRISALTDPRSCPLPAGSIVSSSATCSAVETSWSASSFIPQSWPNVVWLQGSRAEPIQAGKKKKRHLKPPTNQPTN